MSALFAKTASIAKAWGACMLGIMVKRCGALVVLLATVLLASCSRVKTVSANELRSDMLSAISLAAETELFIDQVERNRSTVSFERGHLEYLRQQAADEIQQLRDARARTSLAPRLEMCRAQLESLETELAILEKSSTASDRLSAAKQQVAKIRTALEHAEKS